MSGVPLRELIDATAVAGVGFAPERFIRDSGCDIRDFAVDACLAALDDCGLDAAEIDGVFTWTKDAHTIQPEVMAAHLGVRELGSWGSTGTIAVGSLTTAAQSVAFGLCRHALVYRAMTTRFGATPFDAAAAVGGMGQWHYPYGIHNDIYWCAYHYRRYMATFGISEADIAQVAVLHRAHAQRNPRAAFHGKPLGLDDVLRSRYIARPVHLFDCDMPVDAAIAFVVTTTERARDLRQRPVMIHGWANGRAGDPSLEAWKTYETGVSQICADRLWRLTGLSARDIDTANLYDGYSIMFLQWLEELGFCGRGEAASHIAAGHTSMTGCVPMNTAGGALSEGRTHAAGHVAETVLQLRHAAGERQVAGAELGLATAGGMQTIASAVLLRR